MKILFKMLSGYILLSAALLVVATCFILGGIVFNHKIFINPVETLALFNALVAFAMHTIVEPMSKNLQGNMQESRAWMKKEMETINVLRLPSNIYKLKNKTFPAGFSEMGSIGHDLRKKIISNNSQRPGRTHKKTKSASKNNTCKSGRNNDDGDGDGDGDGEDSAKPQNNGLNDSGEIYGYYLVGIKPVNHTEDLAKLFGVSKKTIQNLQSAKPELLPNASYLPYTKEKLYLAKDIINYLCGAKKTHAITGAKIISQKKRGRPRITLASHTSVIAGK
ncbi:hypothetical protein [Acidithiobacillus ferriphilus]|uniref:hypothetical protein n=1 Tax=Acidithiobacillus ferriphilus TaxID=1689834 RepID=UPI004057A357